MARRSRIITLTLAVIMSISHMPASYAQFGFGGIVYDPANHAQNFRTAVHNFVQLTRQAQQLRNEANMLINQAKHLSKLNLNEASELNRLLGEIAFLTAQAEHVAYDVNRTRELLRQQYPETYDGLSEDELFEQSQQQFQNSQKAYHEAMVMQSKLIESLETDRAMLGTLLNTSHEALGDLQATQTSNQLMGLLVKQSMQAQQLQVSQSRAESIEAARLIAIQAESRTRTQNFLGSADEAYGGGTP